MCFSASASFIAGTVLSVAGVAAIKKIKSPSQIMFASIPLIFAVQQFIEGFLWLSLQNTAFVPWKQSLIFIFLTFAQIVWPTWVPFSFLLLEKDKKRKKILYIILSIGLFLSASLAYRLLTQNLTAEIKDYHIFYDLGFPDSTVHYFAALYIIATIIPPFISSIKKMWSLGMYILGSFIVSKIFFEDYVISVWCFFAAIISVMVYSIVYNLNNPSVESKLFDKPQTGNIALFFI